MFDKSLMGVFKDNLVSDWDRKNGWSGVFCSTVSQRSLEKAYECFDWVLTTKFTIHIDTTKYKCH